MSRTRVITALCVAILVIGCRLTPKQEAATQSPIIGPVIRDGPPEIRDLVPTSELVTNCGGGNNTITKHPSMTVLTSHAVEWEVGGQTGVGVTIGKSATVPVGIDLSAALDSHLSVGRELVTGYMTAWDLPAEPDTIMEYTLMWREKWQPGYVEVRFADREVVRINLLYRTGIESEVIGQRMQSCDGKPIVAQPSSPTSVPPTATIVAQAPSPSPTKLPTATPVPVTPRPDFADWQVPTGHDRHTEYRRCADHPNDNFPEFSVGGPGVIHLNPQSAKMEGGNYIWCFEVRCTMSTEELRVFHGNGDIDSQAVYFCANPLGDSTCTPVPEGSAVSVEGGSCVLSPVLGYRNGVSIKRPRSIRVILPGNTTQEPTISVGIYPVGNPPYIACPP